jgi:hypothetical protein
MKKKPMLVTHGVDKKGEAKKKTSILSKAAKTKERVFPKEIKD